MSTVLAVLSVPLVFVLVAIATRVWEKRLVWPYVEPDASTQATKYMLSAAAAAEALGFTRHSVFRDGKGKIYRIRYELWLARERDVLLLVGGGSLAGIPVDGSWLFTRLSDGTCLVTLDDERGSEYDLAGVTQEAVHVRVPLHRLLESHRRRVASARAPALPYADPVSDHREMLRRRIGTLVQRGYASFCGASGEGWRYTPRGAVVSTFAAYGAAIPRELRRRVTLRP